jgi:hypothetical protein
MSAGFPSINQTPHPLRPASARPGDRERLLTRLGPLISELIAHDLVDRTPSGSFQLRDDVQGHLAAVLAKRSRTEAQVYIGRSCATCGTITATRMIGGARQCGACREAPSESARPGTDSAPSDGGRRSTRPRWIHRTS